METEETQLRNSKAQIPNPKNSFCLIEGDFSTNQLIPYLYNG